MPRKQPSKFSLAGFSLAEVLISLAILGILSAFAVPKLFQTPDSTLGSKQSAKAKDVAFMIVNAYEQYRAANGTVPTTMMGTDLTPYMNYVGTQSVGSIDYVPGSTSVPCGYVDHPCLKFHNGGKLFYGHSTFYGSNTTNCINLIFDPDGVYSGSTSDNYSKSVEFLLYYDGTIRTRGTAKTNSCHSYGCGFNANPTLDPSWFTGL